MIKTIKALGAVVCAFATFSVFSSIAEADPIDVGLLYAFGTSGSVILNDVESKASAHGDFNFTRYNLDVSQSFLPDQTDLLAHDVLFLVSAPIWRDHVGDWLAAMIDAGGGVVMLGPAYNTADRPLGAFDDNDFTYTDEDYWAHLPGLSNTCSGCQRTMLTPPFLPGHPILDGVTGFTSMDGGQGGFQITSTDIHPNAVRIANYTHFGNDTGVPLLSARDFSSGGRLAQLNFQAASDDAVTNGWFAETDGGLIMANALQFAAGSAVPISNLAGLAVIGAVLALQRRQAR